MKPFTFAWKPTNILQFTDKTNATPTAELHISNWKQADLEPKAMLGKLKKSIKLIQLTPNTQTHWRT